MPWFWATCTTSWTTRYFVVRSPRTLMAGCGVFWASTERRLSIWSFVMGWSFQYRLPCSVTVIVIGWITRGVTLISAIGPPLSLPVLKAMGVSVRCYDDLALGRDFADASAGGEEVVQVVREGVELAVRDAVEADEEVVRQHGRDRDEQTDGGHDQRFTHRTGHGVDRGLARRTDLDQRAVDAPHGAEQADERRGRTDGGEHGQAVLEARGFAGHALAQRAVHELRTVERLDQARTFMALVVRGGLRGVERDLGERLALVLLFHEADGVLRVRGFPERGDDAIGAAADANVLDEVDHDPVPRHRGHDHEGGGHDQLDDVVARVGEHLARQVVDAHLLERVGVASGRSNGVGGFLQHDAYLLSGKNGIAWEELKNR